MTERTPISERPKLKLFGGTETNAKSSIILERRVDALEQIVKDLADRLDKIDGLS